MARVLITRLSSFGDVAMLVPVVFSVAARYPQDRFIVLTRKSFAPLFENLGFNISAVTFDASQQHKGIWGLFRLLRSVSRYRYTHIADVHNVLRTKIIRGYMSSLGKESAYIDKGRAEKRDMIKTKDLEPALKPTTERYMEVFEDLGFPAEMVFKNFFEFKPKSLYPLRAIIKEKVGKWIGIAPFAKHKEKIYPLGKMETIIYELSKDTNNIIFLFGAGSQERSLLGEWAEKFPNTISVSGKINLENELLLISYIDVMVTMDSANMHLASLVETPVISIWGATHPNLGFYGYKQDPENIVEINDLDCRPCSVYGETPCVREDYACLNRIEENTILEKIYKILDKNKHDQIEL